ncbi:MULTISPECIES: TM0106 family RecB-like putative nuclease [unclassified Legionella]|uniref:TM0106 family RecB-like putative nuclease n=1 Tax=unclassified Legionella TaxID=2622702 RepID=UPI001E49DA61|nr:TM0106 family RecB-like putative nuclease [Legionella sp. 31fI33]MCC5013791.1 TM0106 family RecB-like putative nuclease [Legionella sp. 31fI33]
MYIETDQIIYAPSDLTLFLESPFASWMEHFALQEPKALTLADETDELLSVLQQKGMALEQKILNHFIERQLTVAQIEKTGHAFADTISAMKSGADIIYQAVLSALPFKGYADFLVKVDGASVLGDFHYEVWDTKLSKTVKPHFLVQLCCYADMLETLQKRRPDNVVVVIGTGETMRFPTRDYFYYYLHLKQRFLQTHQNFSPEHRPNPADCGSWGRWSDYAQTLLLEADHLSEIATITRHQIKKLNKAGIHTMQRMIETPLEQRVKGINPDVFARLKAQAAIQKNSKGCDTPLYQILPHESDKKMGLSLLPPSSPLDIYFDIEGFPLEEGGLEYLWGVVYLDDKGIRQYKDFWAHDEAQEKTAFKSFIEWAFERWQRDPHMHIYHYANYEIAACRKLMGRYGICEDMVDTLLRNEVFVDLYKIVKGSLLLGEPRYSIKNVEHLYRGKRDTEVGSGGDSIVVYERWRESPDGETWETSNLLKSIRDYNVDDCHSTQELVAWLRERQLEKGISYLGKTEIVAAPDNEKVTERTILRDRLLHKANELKAQGLENDAKMTSLFAWVLEFHRREKKPMYWRLFDRLGASDDELFDDTDCLARCVRTERPAYKFKRGDKNLCYEYSFDPNQEFKAAAEKYNVFGQERANGKTISVEFIKEESNLGEGFIVLKTAALLDSVVTLIPDESINPEPIPTAIAAVAEAFAQGRLENTAIYDFLTRSTPRIRVLVHGAPIAPSHEPEERLNQIISAIRNLEDSYLTIQGPPGSGKSYTAKHVIAELLKLGKRIGISSNNHKAINHLLINTAKYCKAENIGASFACTKNTDDALSELGITVYKNESIAGSLQAACVVGTTAWGFARADLVQAFDYLFIDEAGQVSVANLIGMSRAARNIILMGDQMQLGQPSQGSHPEESGLSILDYLLHSTPTIPETMGVFLGTTYRMHSAVNQFISEAIYEGKLESDPDNDRQRIVMPEGYQGILNQEAGIIPVPVLHEGNTQASDEEVACIVKLANELLGRQLITKQGAERLIDWDDMLFVAPYNHQVNKLRQALGKQAKVGSVDKFQGQEAPVVFLSMCASNANESPRGMDFLFNKNRLNVAISRAQCLVVVTYSPMLLDTVANSVGQMEAVNLFCKLVIK